LTFIPFFLARISFVWRVNKYQPPHFTIGGMYFSQKSKIVQLPV
jgi:hypothetical protein